MVLGDQKMILKAYTVWDSAADAYIQPFWATNDKVALRSFHTACTDSGHDFYKHAEDYTLFRIGSFDQQLGDLLPENMVAIARAHELKEIHDGISE